MPVFETPSGPVHYQVEKSGFSNQTVTLINGHTRPGSDFKRWISYLKERNYNVVTLDNRGSGASPYGAFHFDSWVDDIIGVWDIEAVTTSHVVGLSMGGLIAQRLAALYPTRTLSLTLVSTAQNLNSISANKPKNHDEWPADPELLLAKYKKYFAPSFGQNNPLLLRGMVQQTLKNITHGIFLEQAQSQRAMMRTAPDPFLASHPLRQAEKVLILHGEEDSILPPVCAQELSILYPKARLITFPGVGHLPLAEVPTQMFESHYQFICQPN